MAPIKQKVDVNSVSRYGDTKAAEMQTVQEITPEDIPALVEELRQNFRKETTYDINWRKMQLKAFKRMLTEKENEICQALYQDLHKSPFESFASEIGLVHNEIDTALEKLDQWMKPVKKK